MLTKSYRASNRRTCIVCVRARVKWHRIWWLRDCRIHTITLFLSIYMERFCAALPVFMYANECLFIHIHIYMRTRARLSVTVTAMIIIMHMKEPSQPSHTHTDAHGAHQFAKCVHKHIVHGKRHTNKKKRSPRIDFLHFFFLFIYLFICVSFYAFYAPHTSVRTHFLCLASGGFSCEQ